MVPLGNGQAIIGGSHVVYGLIVENSQILLFTCSKMNCKIEALEQKLSMSLSFFVAILIPDKVSGCVSSGNYKYDF